MKKKLSLLAAIVICLSIVATGTIAYFTAEEQVHNVITTNGVDIEIDEWQENEEGELVPYPDEPIDAMPGVTVSKIAEIKNLQAEAYVRARFEVVITQADGSVKEISDEELASVISVTMNGNGKWQQKEGDAQWWYYVDAVPTNGVTDPLFTEVVFDGPNMTNEYQNCTVEVIVYAQGVQTANNGANGLEAAGWPAAE